jgi:hypothetical protein
MLGKANEVVRSRAKLRNVGERCIQRARVIQKTARPL